MPSFISLLLLIAHADSLYRGSLGLWLGWFVLVAPFLTRPLYNLVSRANFECAWSALVQPFGLASMGRAVSARTVEIRYQGVVCALTRDRWHVKYYNSRVSQANIAVCHSQAVEH